MILILFLPRKIRDDIIQDSDSICSRSSDRLCRVQHASASDADDSVYLIVRDYFDCFLHRLIRAVGLHAAPLCHLYVVSLKDFCCPGVKACLFHAVIADQKDVGHAQFFCLLAGLFDRAAPE